MDQVDRVMGAKLQRSRARIDQLVAKELQTGASGTLDEVLHLDELKALHAIAESKVNEFRAAVGVGRVSLELEAMRAILALDAALELENDGTEPSQPGS